MSSNLVLGVRVIRNQYQRIKVENIDLNGKVETLRETASHKINKGKQEIDLIYGGILLEDDAVLSSYGVKPGVTVHVLERKSPVKVKVVKPIPEADIMQLIAAFEDYCYRNVLQRLARPEVLEKIISQTPSLKQDPSAIALLQDPELVNLIADPATLRKVLQVHPALHEAIPHILSYIKENATTANQNVAGTSSGYSYSLDALSDDEDMEPSEGREANPLTRNTSFNAITAAQLAAAIANATTNFSSTGAVINPTPAANSTGPVITNEMFGNALQQAFASSPVINNTPPAFPASNGEETMDAIRNRLQPQLQQMREMGLSNEGLNIRALHATSGDVQAAIELVFNGVID